MQAAISTKVISIDFIIKPFLGEIINYGENFIPLYGARLIPKMPSPSAGNAPTLHTASAMVKPPLR
jgi:hypothetical protein